MSVGPTFDLLLQGGRVIDPGSGTDGPRDVAIRNGKIAVVQSGVLPRQAPGRSWMLRVRSCFED
jgi:dihydroorotase